MPNWDITPYLQLSETFSYSLNRNSQRYYRPVGGVPSFVIEGIGEVSSMSMSLSSKENSIFSDTRLAFSKAMGRHHLDAMAGIRFTSFAFDNSIPQGQYAPPAGNDNNPGITTSMNFYSAAGDNEKWKNLAWYASAQYNYMNRYFVNLDLSMESSNRFGSEASSLGLGGVKWGVFPGVQLGWVLTNERWFPRQNVINYLQLNAGYDLSGNDDIREGVATTSFQVVKYLYESTGIQMNNIGNEHIKWEQTAKWNVGLRTWMLNNRLGLNLDLYHHHTTNLLALRTLDSPLGGVSTVWGNEASLDNNGLELSLSAKPIVSRTFNLEMGFSLGHYANKVKSLPNAAQLYNDGTLSKTGYTSSIYGTDNVATMVGESVGVFYGYKTLGVFASDAEAKAAGKDGYLYQEDNTGARQDFKAGDMHFADLNGDGKIDKQDRTIIGNPNPDIYGNIFATAQWKGLSLNIVFNYSLGNDIYNYQRSLLENSGNFYNQTTAVNRRWHYEGQTTDMPRAVYGDPMGNSRFSDRWIEDGSYLRLKRLNLSYKVPVPQSWSWLQGLTVWGEAVNLFTVTKYLGGDPEMAVANSVLAQGVDAGCVAQGRAFMFGLKVNL
jgi:TonB-linked SusC/RagA family outer membrane protein